MTEFTGCYQTRANCWKCETSFHSLDAVEAYLKPFVDQGRPTTFFPQNKHMPTFLHKIRVQYELHPKIEFT